MIFEYILILFLLGGKIALCRIQEEENTHSSQYLQNTLNRLKNVWNSKMQSESELPHEDTVDDGEFVVKLLLKKDHMGKSSVDFTVSSANVEPKTLLNLHMQISVSDEVVCEGSVYEMLQKRTCDMFDKKGIISYKIYDPVTGVIHIQHVDMQPNMITPDAYPVVESIPKVLWVSGGVCSLGLSYGIVNRMKNRQTLPKITDTGLENLSGQPLNLPEHDTSSIERDSKSNLHDSKYVLPHEIKVMNAPLQQSSGNMNTMIGAAVAAGGLGVMALAVQGSGSTNKDKLINYSSVPKRIVLPNPSELLHFLTKYFLPGDERQDLAKKTGAILVLNIFINILRKIPFGGIISQNAGIFEMSYELIKR